MKRIFVTRGCGASGVSLRPGEIAEVSDDDARILIALGKAKPAPSYEHAGAGELSDAEFPIIEPDLAEAAIVEKPHGGKKAARGEKPAA